MAASRRICGWSGAACVATVSSALTVCSRGEKTRRAIEDYRRTEAGPLENNLIDELVEGELDTRAEFFRHNRELVANIERLAANMAEAT